MPGREMISEDFTEREKAVQEKFVSGMVDLTSQVRMPSNQIF